MPTMHGLQGLRSVRWGRIHIADIPGAPPIPAEISTTNAAATTQEITVPIPAEISTTNAAAAP